MTQFLILRDLGYVVFSAAILLLIARALRMPNIMAYILAGVALGPLLGLFGASESLERFSEIGIALLLFLVGLELSLDKIRGVGRAAALAGLGQVALTAGAGFLAARLLGFDNATSALLSLVVAFSSTVVVVKLLDSRGELDELNGRLAVGVLLVQDVLVLIVLTLLAAVGAAGDALHGPASDGGSPAAGLIRVVGGMALLGTSAFAAARFLLPRAFAWLARSAEALFILSLAWCFLFIVAAERLGLSVEIGAFVAGVSLAQLPYNHELSRRVQPLVDFFIAVFFVMLGAGMRFGAATTYWTAALVLSILILIVKPAAVMLLLPRFGYGQRTSFLTAIALGQVSEFSFIVAALGVSVGLLDESAFSLIGVIGILTIGVSSYLITYGEAVYRVVRDAGLLRPFHAIERTETPWGGPPFGHVVVVGLNALGRRIVRALLERGERVVAIDTDPRKLEGLNAAFVMGNAGDEAVLDEANVAEAKLLVSALQIEDANSLLAWRCRQLGVPVCIHAFEPALIDDLRHIGVDHMMVSKHDGIRQVAAELRKAGVMN